MPRRTQGPKGKNHRIENFQSAVFHPSPTQCNPSFGRLKLFNINNNIVLLPHAIHVSLSTGITFREDRWHYWLVLVMKSDVTWTDNHLIDCETRICKRGWPEESWAEVFIVIVISSSPLPKKGTEQEPRIYSNNKTAVSTENNPSLTSLSRFTYHWKSVYFWLSFGLTFKITSNES